MNRQLRSTDRIGPDLAVPTRIGEAPQRQRSNGADRRRWRVGAIDGLVPALLLGLPALLPAAWPAAARRLQYDRPRIEAGELWRIVTCHWTHWSLDHLVWDLGMLVLLAALCWRLGRGRTVAAAASAAVLIPAVLWSASPEMRLYRGLSGLDAALFVLLAAGLLRRELAGGRRGSAAVAAGLLLGFAGKVVYETVAGTTLFVDPAAGFVPVPLAHLVGGGCGLAAALGASGTPGPRLGSASRSRIGQPMVYRNPEAAPESRIPPARRGPVVGLFCLACYETYPLHRRFHSGKPLYGKDHVASPCAHQGDEFAPGESWWEPAVAVMPAPPGDAEAAAS